MIKRYNECFATKTGNCSKKASEYLRGLIQSSKGNMSAMAEVIPDTNSQSLQHFISYSPFDEEKLKKQINEDVNNKWFTFIRDNVMNEDSGEKFPGLYSTVE